jgi:hypothetical protein
MKLQWQRQLRVADFKELVRASIVVSVSKKGGYKNTSLHFS